MYEMEQNYKATVLFSGVYGSAAKFLGIKKIKSSLLFNVSLTFSRDDFFITNNLF